MRALRAYGGLVKGGASQHPRSAGREREVVEAAGLWRENPAVRFSGICAERQRRAVQAAAPRLGIVLEEGIAKARADFQARSAASRGASQKVLLLL